MYRIIETHPNYMVSVDGVVTNTDTGIELKWQINRHRRDETTVCLCKDGKVSRVKISHLVAKAFPEICGEWFDGCEVDHVDTNRLNNNAYNLRVTDRTGNMGNPLTRRHVSEGADRQARSERMRGDNNPTRKPGYWTEERRNKIGEATHKHYQEQGSPSSKAVRSINNEGDVTEYESLSEAFRKTGIPVCQISAACTGRQKTAHGLKWMYI